MRTIFQRLSIMSLAVCGLFVGACSDSSATAAGSYVKASSEADKAVKAFAEGRFADALSLSESAEKYVSDILTKYPDSDIAFKIVSDASLRLGPWAYSDFRQNIIPSLRIYAASETRPFDLAWAIAYSGNTNTSSSISQFASLAAFSPVKAKELKERGLDVKTVLSEKQVEEILKLGVSVLKNDAVKKNIEQDAETAKILTQKVDKGLQPAPFEKMGRIAIPVVNPEKFLNEARKESTRIVYNVEASQNLLKSAAFASADESVRADFSQILKDALENAKKISTRKHKNSAISNIVLALARAGLNDEALEGAMSIDADPALTVACIEKIAYSYAEYGDFDGALKVAAACKADAMRNEMTLRFVADMARYEMLDKGLSAASGVKDPSVRSLALLTVAGRYWGSDPDKAAKILFNVKPLYLNDRYLADFCRNAGIEFKPYASKEARLVSGLASVSGKLLKHDKDMAGLWLEAAVNRFNLVADKQEIVLLAYDVGSLMLELGKTDEVIEFVSKAISKVDVGSMSNRLADLGAEAQIRGQKDTAAKLFALALPSDMSRLRLLDHIYLAWQMQLSGFDREKSLMLLKNSIPSLKIDG